MNEYRSKLGINVGDYVFCFIGRLVKDKGIEELVVAFNVLQGKKSNCKLLLIGPLETALDPLSDATLQLISSNENIISVGFQADVRPYLLLADSFVFPSHREGFPNVLLQAGAMGKPSIVTDISGSNEIIENDVNGHIIPVKNVQELLKTMQDYTIPKYQFNAHQIRLNIVNRYSNAIVWDAINAFYQEKLHDKGLV